MKERVKQIVSAPWFERGIIAFILINGVILGMETSPALVDHYGDFMHLGNHIILGVFILEALLKMIAVAPQVDRYFRDG
jgi:voltage-gated sodium channel